ncbi:hypothetical protein PUNSTDRAFT_52231 [Punctularia strigosozonata HHB-11173 SS5]|uniref:uncharacterized protein n=1 Tax=Punctularia strigosozonata (strain HHB-11173) TaxID=741275 RepID=UPI0004417D97|nr:uncharacterized protein PUNSTDRAFT_52231 [Punctularia strigosozonata HHB-11173 SS5]EIN08749.1 hypothetical protein PUNSTDRAFT_52231 [Punctularia strigosozonata HHB-11173 SS5]
MTRFGDFAPLCHQLPSYPWCNLFYRQLEHKNSTALVGDSTLSNRPAAPVGINPECGIPRLGHDSSIGNVANIVACAVSIVFVLALILGAHRRRAAVGRVEIRYFFVLYLLTLPFQLISTGSLLEQGTTSLTVITAIHAGLVAATFWALLANGIVATQVVEDGTISSMIPFHFFVLAFFVATTYISLDTAFNWTSAFAPSRQDPASLHNIALFVLTNIWPAVAAIVYFALMLYIVLGVLNEVRPMWFFSLAFILFVLSQLDYYLLNKVICKGANHKVDGSFVATLLETAAVGVIYLAWRSITEESWDDDYYGR